MLPENQPSIIPLQSAFLPPDERVTSPLIDYERGGVALNDATQGLLVRNWRCWLEDSIYVRLQAEGDPMVHTLFEDDQIEELSFCFDQNMRWAVAYTQLGVLKLRWFDSQLGDYTITVFEAARNPKLAMDDKRPAHLGTNDMILAYIRGNSLCYRQQRDRFSTERTLKDNLYQGTRLKNIGMNSNLRFQFELV
jgi:hypothetical protein